MKAIRKLQVKHQAVLADLKAKKQQEVRREINKQTNINININTNTNREMPFKNLF